MYDGWGRRFSYAVDPTATVTNALPMQLGVAWCGDPITVNDSTGAARSTGAIYAIISHGAGGHGGYTSNGSMYNAGNSNANKLTNCHCTSAGVANATYTPTYVEMMPTLDTTGNNNNFDDIVTFKEPWQMQTLDLPLASSSTGTAAPSCIYVMSASGGGAHIDQYKSNGTYLNTVSCYHTAPPPVGTLQSSGQITLDQRGNLWVDDQSQGRVNEFTTSPGSNGNANCPGTYGSYVNRYGSWGGAPAVLGRFSNSGGVAVDMYGNIWMGDAAGARIQMLNLSTGTWVGQVGCDGTNSCAGGSADGQLAANGGGSYPIVFDKNNNLWVADPQNNRVEEFTINYSNVTGGTNPGKNMGTWVQTIGGGTGCAGGYLSATTCSAVNGNAACCAPNAASCTCAASTGMGNFNGSANGIAIDPDGSSVWVSDGSTDRLQKFVISGATSTLVQSIGGGLGASCPTATACTNTPAGGARCSQPCTSTTSCYCSGGAANGQFNLSHGMAFDSLGNLWVLDVTNNRVQEINPAIAGINASGGYINGVTGSLGYIGSFGVPGAGSAFAIAISR